ncbi:alpha/beta hydrolase [Alkalibacillus almallahensis]|uniref:alpha/beta hydrolase n=1 Tax=Alkalibacillus almallahensis TaxID=1379154 RepID=UPI00141DFC0E|nr:alpha/beta hydrolase [Alkalibacillus almallahensis]NIK12129.1 lysophospholipase [Alkalibacillus almallahensis]
MVIHKSRNGKAVIVIVHGAFEHSGRYEWQISQWNEAGYHVIIGDLPGHGESEGKRGHVNSFDEYIKTVQKWLDEAKYFELPVYLLGHSMGGLIVIRTLEETKEAVTGVILSSPGLGLQTVPHKPVYHLSKLLDKIMPSIRFKTNVKPQLATRNEAFHIRDESDPLFLHKVSVRWFHEFERGIDQAFNQIRYYPDLPTLFMQAGEDKLVSVSDVEKFYNKLAVQDKKYIFWPDLYHEVFNEPERDEVFEVAKDFTDALLPSDQEGS